CDGHEDIVTGDEVIGPQHAIDVVAGGGDGTALVVVAGPQAALNRSAEALDRRGGKHPFCSAAYPDYRVDVAVSSGGRNRRRRVAVRYEVNFHAKLVTQLFDQLLVTIAVEDDDSHVLRALLLGVGDAPHVLSRC